MENKLNLEIYSFVLNGYSINKYETYDVDKYYTTSIISSTNGECGYISDEDAAYTKKALIDTKRRSCDIIDGTIKNMATANA